MNANAKSTTANSSVRRHLSKIVGALSSVLILSLALWFLHGELAGLSRAAVFAQIRAIAALTLLTSVGCAVCSYLVLSGYDALALRYVGRKIAYRHSGLTSFLAFAVGNNVGVAALSGGAIRYRLYSLVGLSGLDITKVIVFVSVTFALGASLLSGVALLLMPSTQTDLLKLSPMLLDTLGMLLLAVPLCYMAATLFRRAPMRMANWKVSLPRPSIAFAQIGVSILDLSFAAATLYVLLAPTVDMGFLPFLGIYLLAMVAGLISGVPGGVGVFETVLLAALPQVETGALLGTVIVYRLIYYIAPLSLALLLLVANELRQHTKVVQQTSEVAKQWLSSIAPQAFGSMVFLAGVVLLISGSMPAIEQRLQFIAQGLPLPILELSHLTGSVVGVGLLILARGLYHRLHGAYVATLVALAVGIAVSLLKGLDYEEALLLSAILAALWLSRAVFYRQESLASQGFTVQWLAVIVLALGLAIWVGMLNYRTVEYTDQLWWRFAFNADAPRMLRASVVAVIAALAFVLWKVLRRPSDAGLTVVSEKELARVKSILDNTEDASANVALLGDKRFLWSTNQEAFIMYQVSGDSWIALGDPVGPLENHEALVWAFRELVDRHDGRPVFYQVSDTSLALYVDLGLVLAKIGEDARVPLAEFSLEGSHRAEFRQAVNRAEKHGATFTVIPRAKVSSIVAELRGVSDSWLQDKSAAEKGFSLGAFSEQYIVNFDVAIVRVDNKIVAFANLWPAPAGGELSIDLMRYDEGAPKGIMDYLFVELMLWGREQGYQWFSLGMAPLSGLEQRALAPLWHKLGHLVFEHGESFYNFEGLRNYKEKFEPEWRSRYIACEGGVLSLPRALVDTSRLISGGVTRLLSK